MNLDKIVENMIRQISNHHCSGQCFVGTRMSRRIHPYDGYELPFPTCCWVYANTDSPIQASKVVNRLVALGVAKRHIQNEPGRIVFAYFEMN